jgi:hypothetical protein
MKTKTKKKSKKPAGNEGAMKAIQRLEIIKTNLIHHEDGGHEFKDADLLNRIINASLAQKAEGSGRTERLIIEVVHVNDRGERIEPTEKEREEDRKLEGYHGKD